MSLSTDDAELITRAIQSQLADLYTAEIGRVERFYTSTQTVDVSPVIRRAVPTGLETDPKYEDLPIIPNVPLLTFRGSDFSLSFKITKGDHVLLIVLGSAFAQWRKTGKTSNPGDLRKHHISNCVALPMIVPYSGVLSEAQAGANAFTIAGPMIILGDPAATDFAALASRCDANFNALQTTLGSGTAGGNPVTFGAPFNPQATACTQVKIK